MNEEQLKQYIQERYESATDYYNRRAVRNKRYHYACSVSVLIISVSVACAQGVSDQFRRVAAILAPLIPMVTGISALFKFQEEWLSSRTTWDALRHEKYWKEAGVGPYEGATDKNGLFVSRVEALIDREGTEWRNRQVVKFVDYGKPSSS